MSQQASFGRFGQLALTYCGKFLPLEQHLADIAAVTRDEIVEAARTWMAPEGWAVAAVGPRKAEDPVREASGVVVGS